MTSAQEIRDRLEGYARAKIASIMQPMTEQLLIDQVFHVFAACARPQIVAGNLQPHGLRQLCSLQPGDPIEYMVRYLVQNRSDLRKHVVRCDCSTRVCPPLPVARSRQARTQHSR